MLLDDHQTGKRRAGPSPSSLAGSVALHGAVVAWMFFGPSLGTGAPQRPKTLYQELIAGNEKKLVWYNLRDKLPQVSPIERHGVSRLPRAETQTGRQAIVANPPKAKKAEQMVYLPAPPKELDREVQSPNLFAFTAPKLPPPEVKPAPKLFAPPPEVVRALAQPEPLPDAPRVAASTAKVDLPQTDTLPKPKPKEFVPPQEAKREPQPTPVVPDAPRVTAAQAPPPLRPRSFVPPPDVKAAPGAAPAVPEAPNVAVTTAKVELPAPARLRQREFVPPRQVRSPPGSAPVIPDAPKLGPATARADLPQAPRLQPKKFVPPQVTPGRPAAPNVPDAPKLTSTTAKLTLPPQIAPRLQPRRFVPPGGTVAAAGQAPSVPDAPNVKATGVTAMSLPAPGRLARPKPREFSPPPGLKPPAAGTSSLPDAPHVAPQLAAAAGTAGGPARTFLPPAPAPRRTETPDIAPAPALDAAAASGNLSAAIVGLKPAEELKSLPEGSRPAQFSSGPQRRQDGGTGEPVETAKIFVPDLMIRDAGAPSPDAAATLVKNVVKARLAPTSAENLAEAVRSAPLLRPEARLPGVMRVSQVPDPRLSGRVVFMVAIQMPNVTSYIGSWTMWFADREPMPGQVREMRAPVPTRKVDPKYAPSAMAERVEGTVQLSAIIRRDGHVDSISLIKHLDDRLDFSANEALQKWEFEPARRDGQPVDVDAIFEVPFRLEPLTKR
jgi:TonB family protein